MAENEEPEPDVVLVLLDALESFVDKRVESVTAALALRPSMERTAHAAKQGLEIAVRKALHAAAHNTVSRVPKMSGISSSRMPAVGMPGDSAPTHVPIVPLPPLPALPADVPPERPRRDSSILPPAPMFDLVAAAEDEDDETDV